MKVKNLLTMIAANVRMNYKYTILPAILLLFVIPFVYGTTNLDDLKSADCLERMAALIGIPMFTALIWQENSRSLYEMIALRSFRFVILLRIGLSIAGTLLLILVFEIYMCICGCSFPFIAYAFRTLMASMALGFVGLFLSAMAQNTVSGYLGAFCFYFIVQTNDFAKLFKPVTNGIHFALVLFLAVIGFAIYRQAAVTKSCK